MREGLADPILDAQRIFRGVLDAMARPGRIATVPAPAELPPPLSAATAAVCLALLDFETPLWLDGAAASAAVIEYLRFHCGVPVVTAPGEAAFALAADPGGLPSLEAFAAGTDEYPDRSATLIVQADGLRAGIGRRLTGPGIAGAALLDVQGVPEDFWVMVRKNRDRFPLGVDLIVTAGCQVAALPRTTLVEG
jgi:alpha-D-ribose 1-methylphosphonate 5-triphosphate synthase subunit PhnH